MRTEKKDNRFRKGYDFRFVELVYPPNISIYLRIKIKQLNTAPGRTHIEPGNKTTVLN